MANWFSSDVKNRAWRTFLQGLAVSIILPVVDIVMQTVQTYILESKGNIDWNEVRSRAITSAIFGLTMVLASYVHRQVLDPIKGLPTAQPPRPPDTSAAEAPATTKVT